MSWFNKITSFLNSGSGQGGQGDMSGGNFSVRPRLPAHLIEGLVRQEPLLRIAMEAAPEDIVRSWRHFDDVNKDWVEVEEKLGYRQSIEKALFWSEVFGGALIVPRFDQSIVDLDRMAEPFSQPRNGSLLGWKVFMPHQLRWPTRGVHQDETQFDNGLPIQYEIESKGKLSGRVRIHHSWTIPVFGMFKSDTFETHRHSNCEALFGESRVDLVYEHLTRAVGGLSGVSHLLSKSNIDVLKLAGVADAMEQCNTLDEMVHALSRAMERATHTVRSGSVYQPFILDKNETLERQGLGQGANGAVDIVTQLVDAYVAVTRVPKTRLLGEQSKGLGNSGEGDLRHYYDRVDALRERRLTPVLNRMDEIVANNGGLSKDFNWQYQSLNKPTAKELAEIQDKNASRDQKYIQAGMPFAMSKAAERLDRDETYSYTEDELKQIRQTDSTFSELNKELNEE